MIILRDTDTLRLVTASAGSVSVYLTYVDRLTATTVDFDRQRTAITLAATTTILGSPAATVKRTVKAVTIINQHATLATTVTVEHFDGTTATDVKNLIPLAAYESLEYDDQTGWKVFDVRGQFKQAYNATATPAVNELNLVVTTADVVNNNAIANTIADITGLSMPVVSGQRYWFSFQIPYDAAASTTGSRFCLNGPAFTRLSFQSIYTLSATAQTLNASVNGYDLPAGSNATSTTTGNIATLEGFFTAAADGNLIARFASEVANSAITVKVGAILRWVRLI
jgi:hypothetical protein